MMKKTKKSLLGFVLLLFLICDLLHHQIYKTPLYISVFSMIQQEKYYIHIDLDDHILYLFHEGKVEKKYPVSSGRQDTPSPIGTWKIISKSNWGEGFGGSWMGLNVPWGKYGIHGTNEPWSIGRSMSHGCIRMYNADAKELRKIVPAGTKVTIVKGPYGPFGNHFRTLKPGDRGSDIFAVQKRLKDLGYYNGYPDGIYGDGMKYAVHRFQKDHHLYIQNDITPSMYEAMGFLPFE